MEPRDIAVEGDRSELPEIDPDNGKEALRL